MPKQYFLKSGNLISGPFEQVRILIMLKNGKLHPTDMLSPDKVHWAGLKEVLNMIDPAVIDQCSSKSGKAEKPLSVQEYHRVVHSQRENTEEKIQHNSVQLIDEKNVKNESLQFDCSFWRIFSDTIASLGNGSCFLQRIYHKGRSAITASCIIALLLIIVITSCGCVIFQSHCTGDKLWFYLRSMVWVFACGGMFFLCNTLLMLIGDPSDDRVSGMSILTGFHVMMDLAVLTTFSHGLIFTVLPHWQLQYTIILASGITGFFWFNAFTKLRICLLSVKSFSAGWSGFWAFLGIWLSTLLYMLIILPIYL